MLQDGPTRGMEERIEGEKARNQWPCAGEKFTFRVITVGVATRAWTVLFAWSLILLVARDGFAFRTANDDGEFEGSTAVVFPDAPQVFQVVTDPPSTVTQLDVEAAVRAAVDTWRAPLCAEPAVSFDGSTQIAAKAGDGRSTIAWVVDWEKRRLPADAAATTDVQYESEDGHNWRIVEADVYLNAGMNWVATSSPPVTNDDGSSDEDQRDLQAVLTHEFGHALGLLHPCEKDATAATPKCSAEHEGLAMNPIYRPAQRALAPDDVDGVCSLYPAKQCTEAGCPAGQTCSNRGCVSLCGERACSVDEVCRAERCVQSDSCQFSSCVGQRCAADSDCANRERCSDRRCVRGARPLADPCSGASDCVDGACIEGACTATCSTPGDCPTNTRCDLEAHVCHDDLLAFGAGCASPTECRGDRCLREDTRPAVCTRACGEGLAVCPEGWHCASVDEERVCAPSHVAAAGGGGCMMMSASPSPFATDALLFLSLTSALAARLRKRHKSWFAPLRKRLQ